MGESKEGQEQVNHSLLYKGLVEGEEIEVWSDTSSPPPNFVVSVGGKKLDVRELRLILTAHGSEIVIRAMDMKGNVTEWHEFYIPNPSFYLRAKVINGLSSTPDLTKSQMSEIAEALHSPFRR